MLLTLAVSTVAWAQRSSRHEVADPVATLVTTATPIVCATYNIRMNTPSDGDNAWPNRARRVRELIRFHEWDIFGTQEGFKGQLDDLAQMEEYSYIGVGRDDGAEAGEHSAIFYRRERFELLDKGDFWLSETPEKPSLGWDAPSNVRICSWGRFRDRATGREFCMFCAHYDHIGVRAREESSKLVLRRIAEIADGVPTIFVGDLNSTPDSGAVTVLEGAMNDARKVTQQPPYGPVGTFGGFVAGARVLADRIDYIFVSPGISVLKYGVLTDYVDNRLSSDHLPVVAKLVIND
jgi:endonuclease/exonuclease/phosphatase family metal-dependent hydrolase